MSEEGRGGGSSGVEDLMARVGIKDRHIRELHERLAGMRVEADEAVAAGEAKRARAEELGRERGRLRERISTLEEELRVWRRGREGSERKIERLERELERRGEEVSRRDSLIQRRDDEMETFGTETESLIARKEGALDDAMRRVAGLERDLEEREDRITDLEAKVEELRGELAREREAVARLADPANRLRSGIDLFNDSKHRDAVTSLSRTLGQPNVHIRLAGGEEPPAVLTFTWRGVTWQRYAANPGLAVEEPRVYREGAGENLSGVEEEPPNARIGPGGKVLLGL